MAGRGVQDWFEREEFIGQISDIRVQNLQVEREAVQKRTFTRWMNLHLEKCDPPLQVQDLFQDIQDGHVLLALLEELSGCSLLHSFRKSSHRIFRLNNIAKVLSFLEERNVKLVSIDAADVADGNSSIILGLIWNIILFFQIKELTGNIRSHFPSTCSLSSIPTTGESDPSVLSSAPSEDRRDAGAAMRDNSKAIRKLLQWIQRRTRKYGVAVQDFGRSWTSGLAFLALIKSIDSSLVDMRKALLRNPRENLEDAFRIAHFSLGIPRLLEPEDVAIDAPDEQSIIMYASQFLEHFPGIEEPEEPRQPIERSVSMGGLNLRDGDSDRLRNGALRGRVRQRSCMFQRDHPPPKVWVSSEDRSVTPPRLRPPAARSWSTEGFLSAAVSAEDVPTGQVGQPLGAQAPDAQLLSSAPESAVSDSAFNSPDSWVDSELMLEGPGDSWEVYRATPVDVTPVDEGFLSFVEDRAPDELSTPESYVLDGVLLGTNLTSDPAETDALQERHVMDEGQIQKDDEPRGQVPSSSGPEDLFTTDHLDQALTSITPPHLEEDGDEKDHTGQPDGQAENLQLGTRFGEPEHRELGVETPHGLMEDFLVCEQTNTSSTNQEGASRTRLNIPVISISSEPDEDEAHGAPDPGSGPDQVGGLGLQKVSGSEGITSEVHHPHSSDGPDQSCRTGDSRVPAVSPPCPISADIKPTSQRPGVLLGNESLEDVAGHESCRTRSVGGQETGPPRADRATPGRTGPDLTRLDHSRLGQAGPDQIKPDQDRPDRAGPDRTRPDLTTESPLTNTRTDNCPDCPVDGHFDTHQNPPGPKASQVDHQTGRSCSEPWRSRTMDLFYSDSGRGSPTEDLVADPVEPMDMFYPDKEAPVLAEPPDADLQRWPSVLSVSALQPAPVPDDTTEAQDPARRGDHVTPVAGPMAALDSVTRRTNQEPADAPASCVLCGVTISGTVRDIQDGRAAASEASNRHTGSSSRPHEVQIPTVLRHRKRVVLTKPTDGVRTGPGHVRRDDSQLRENWELWLLLLLWLLLYSLWLLPQMDLQTLPDLLLSLDH